MNGMPITISARVDDGFGDTVREDVEAFVLDTGDVVYADGWAVPESELSRESNKQEVVRGRLLARHKVVSEKILALDSGTCVFTFCSSVTKSYSRMRLVSIKESLEKQLTEV